MTLSGASILRRLSLIILLVAIIYFGKELLMPMAIAAVIASLFLPMCGILEKKGFPKFLAVTSCFLTFISAVVFIGALLGWQISELSSDIELVKLKALEIMNGLQGFIFSHFGITSEEQGRLLLKQQSSIGTILPGMAGSMASMFTNSILVLVYIFLFLYYRSHIKEFILKIGPAEQRRETEQLIGSAANVTQKYLSGLIKMIMCLWVMYGIGFSILGIHNALFFAFLCGILEIIPFIGNLTGSAITLLVALVHGAGLPVLGGIVVIYSIVQLVQGWLLEPLIVGHHVRINPLFTIIVLVIGELLWGIPGVFLAIPLSAMLKIIFDHIEPLKPYGFLIGELEQASERRSVFVRLKHFFNKK